MAQKYSCKVSVIIPVYNCGRCLPRCIDSMLHQTFRDFELILVNDGSTDDSEAVCRRYKDNRIKVVSQPNRGVSAARNRGLEEVCGEWIYFCDADDELYEDALERLTEKLSSSEVSFVMAGYEVYDESGRIVYSRPEREELMLSADQCVENMFNPQFYNYQGYLWTKLFRRDIIEEAGLKFDERISFNEDRLFCTQYLCSMSDMGFYFTHPIYKYYKRQGSSMSSLEYSFNYKYLTDLDAFAIMLKTIERRENSEVLVLHCKNEFLNSIDRIRRMCRRSRLKDNAVILKMRYAQFHFIGLRTLMYLRIVAHTKIGVLVSELYWRLLHWKLNDDWFYNTVGKK